MKTKLATDEEVQEIFDYIDSFNAVRLKTVNGKMTGRKIKTVDGLTTVYHEKYLVNAIEGKTLPVDGDYPLKQFRNIYIAADMYPANYIGERKTASNNSYLEYIGETTEG